MNSEKHRQYLRKIKQQKIAVTVTRILIFLLFLILWEAFARIGWINDFIFSSPSRILRAFTTITIGGNIVYHTAVTLLETLVSFFTVTALSIVTALLFWRFQWIADIFEPYLIVLNSLPKSALAPLLIVWLGANVKTIIVVGVTIAVFGSIMTLYTSFQKTDPDKIKLIYTLGGTTRDALFKVVLPASVPCIISNMKVNIGLCLVGVIIGEFLASNSGLGYLIIYGSQVFKMDYVLASIVILCGISMLFYAVLALLSRKYRENT